MDFFIVLIIFLSQIKRLKLYKTTSFSAWVFSQTEPYLGMDYPCLKKSLICKLTLFSHDTVKPFTSHSDAQECRYLEDFSWCLPVHLITLVQSDRKKKFLNVHSLAYTCPCANVCVPHLAHVRNGWYTWLVWQQNLLSYMYIHSPGTILELNACN